MKTAFARMGRMTVVLSIAVFVLPNFAFAATNVSSRTTQLLPPGGTSCQQISVTSVTPYVYDGSLDSFDVVVPDSSYVAIGGSVGTEIIPFRQMTRATTPDGQLRIHTDIDSTAIHGSLPISVTLISAKQGSPVCAATIAFAATATGTTVPATSVPAPTPVVSNNGSSSTTTTHPVSTGSGSTQTPSHVPSGSTTTTGTTTVTTGTSSETQSSFAAMCAASGAFELWFILLALYVVIVAIAALVQPPLVEKSPAIPVALVLVPLIILVGFWYFMPACRAATWIPVVLLIVAIVGLLVAFRERKGTSLILLPATKPQPMPKPVAPVATNSAKPQQVTPPAATKPAQSNPQNQQSAQKPPQQQNNQSQQKK